MSTGPGPAEAPELYESATIGPYEWSKESVDGAVLIDVETEREATLEKPNGKGPPRTKDKGPKAAAVTMSFRWTRKRWARGNEIRLALDPNGVNAGKVWEITAREPNDRGVRNVFVRKASRLTITGDVYAFTLTGDGWTEPAAAAAGGTKTPTSSISSLDQDRARVAAAVAAQKAYGNSFASGNATLPLGEIQPTGLDDPAKKPGAGP